MSNKRKAESEQHSYDVAEEISSDESDSEEEMSEEEHLPEVDDDEFRKREANVKGNPWSYNAWLEWISALRSRKEVELVHQARNSMSESFPLSEALWLQWITDERRLVTTHEQRVQIMELYKRAVKDINSVTLWQKYGLFQEEMFYKCKNEEVSSDDVRASWEEAITAVGLDLKEGSLIWNSYRSFEQRLLEELQTLLDQSHAQAAELVLQQKDRIRRLFRRQLSIPLDGMKKVMKQYKEWEIQENLQTKEFSNFEKQLYQTALSMLKQREPYENKINSLQHAASLPKEESQDTQAKEIETTANFEKTQQLLEAWKEYIDFEKNSKKPDVPRVICLYERELRHLNLYDSVWMQYLQYLDETLSLPAASDSVLPIYRKAVRYCPWVGNLWCAFLRALERANSSLETMESTFEEGLVAGLQSAEDALLVFQGIIDYYVRLLPADFKQKEEEMKDENQENPPDVVSSLREKFNRAVEYMSTYFSGQGFVERLQRHWAMVEGHRIRNLPECRKLYEMVLKSDSLNDGVWEEAIHFEWAIGSIESARRLFKRASNTLQDYTALSKLGSLWISFERLHGTLAEFSVANDFLNRRWTDLVVRNEKQNEARQSRLAAAQKEKANPKKTTKSGRSAKEAKKNDDPPKKRQKRIVKSQVGEKNEPKEIDNRERHTVFISNLPFTVSEEQTIQTEFAGCGEIIDVRIARENNDKSKGYAFVDFATKEAVEKALQRNGETVWERKINVQISTPITDRQPKHSEERTLFVTNLPFTATADQIKEYFTQHGSVKEVRCPVDAGGKFKGFAYVELNDEESIVACLRLSRPQMNGRPLQIRRSAPPPPQKESSTNQRNPKESARMSYRNPARHARHGLQLVPRSLRAQQTEQTEQTEQPKNQSEQQEKTQQNQEISQTEQGKPKSNADFRNMLLGKKP